MCQNIPIWLSKHKIVQYKYRTSISASELSTENYDHGPKVFIFFLEAKNTKILARTRMITMTSRHFDSSGLGLIGSTWRDYKNTIP